MAVVLQMVSPVRDAFIPLGPRMREVWTNESLAADFGDLLAWRDQLYDRHRGGLAASAARVAI
jgi:glutathione S-transferase